MMKKATIFALIFLIININPVNANEECTSLTEEQIQSSIDKVVEGKTPSEISVEAIINQINEDFNTSCTQEQFFNLQRNALETGKCLEEFEFNEFYKIADNFVEGLGIFRDQAATALASTQQFMVDVEALNLGPIAEIANAGSQNIDQVNALEERITVLEQRNEELAKELGYSTASGNLSDSSTENARLDQINAEVSELYNQIDDANELQDLINSSSEGTDNTAAQEQVNSTRQEISSLEGIIAELEADTNGLTVQDINNRISDIEAQISQLQSESNSRGSDTSERSTASDNPLEQEFQSNIDELSRLNEELRTLLTNVSETSEDAINASINEANLMEQEAMDLYFGVYIQLKMAADYLAMLEIHDRAFFSGMLRVASNCDAEYYKSNGLDLQYGKLIKKLSDVSSILEATADNLKEVAKFEATTFNALKQKYASIGVDFSVQFFECPVDEPDCEPPPEP